MIEFLLGILMQYLWIIITVSILVVIGRIVNMFDIDYLIKDRINFTYADMPVMKPIRIPTKGKGFWWALWTWGTGRRTWILTENFYFELNGKKYMVPAGFIFDGASIPKFLSSWLSPVGILLIGGIVHDWIYRKTYLLRIDGTQEPMFQKEADKIFRDINVEINGFVVLNFLAYYALKTCGWYCWRKNRKLYKN